MIIDLRSDTVTQPSAAMRAAMAAAAVGDDGYHEDPTVRQLEERAAALLGKAAGLFVPSGTMSNLVAVLSHCPPDHRLVVLTNSHINRSETGSPLLARYLQKSEVPTDRRGVALLDALRTTLEADGSPVGVFCYENTHNAAGGTALTPAETADMLDLVRSHGIPIHLDGARIFNAAVALGLPARELAAAADSATFCLSKGLGAPVGSVLCGSTAFIERAREVRKHLGGTMRQAGIVAAAGLVALDTMIERLAEDHANARWLAEQLAQIPGLAVQPALVETNIIFVEVTGLDPEAFRQALDERGVKIGRIVGDRRFRLVTHVGVDRAMLARAVEVIAEVAALTAVAAEAL